MTGIRTSFVYCKEDSFGGGKPADSMWISPPVGSFFNFTHSRSVSKLQSAGNKTWDDVAYGAITGSWEWTFTMDYDYLEPMALVFEDHKYDAATKTHHFAKANNDRVPSFTVMKKQLNRIAKPSSKDETVVLKGCVVRNMRVSKSAGTSEMNVTLTGFYATEQMSLDNLLATDYKPYTGRIVEFSCLFVDEITNDGYVANTESMNIAIENNASAIYSTCSPVASTYHEGNTTYNFGTTAYSDDPSKYKQRLYSGGHSNTRTSPASKGLQPVDMMYMVSFSNEYMDLGGKVADAYTGSTYSAKFSLEDVVIKSLTWQKGDGSKLMDQINSTDVRLITLDIKSPTAPSKDNLWTSANSHAVTTISSGTTDVTEDEEAQEPTT